MSALLGYPFLIEPLLPLSSQTKLWAAGFILFLILLASCAFTLYRKQGFKDVESLGETDLNDQSESAPSRRDIITWISLSFVPSSLLLGVTTHITTDVAPMPLLWIIPLAIYLVSFIIVFSKWERHHQRYVAPVAWLLCIPGLWFLVVKQTVASGLLLFLYVVLFSLLTMVFHGELALRRPPAKHLTLFFLCMSIGGALGGLFNGLFAPILFSSFIEFFAVMVISSIVSLFFIMSDEALMQAHHKKLAAVCGIMLGLSLNVSLNDSFELGLFACIIVLAGLIAVFAYKNLKLTWAVILTIFIGVYLFTAQHNLLYQERSFFSTHLVRDDPSNKARKIIHGTTVHGIQSVEPHLREQALSYHHPAGPAGRLLKMVQDRQPAHYAILGLGAGALAAYCRGELRCDFFEIDPVVVKIAREHFFYLQDCGPLCTVEVGDGRLLIEAKPPQTYDIIVLDAYSSDAVPVHLITHEALVIYRERLRSRGALLFNISNRYLDLRVILAPLAHAVGLRAYYQSFDPTEQDQSTFASHSSWVVLVQGDYLDDEQLKADRWLPLTPLPGEPLWTDDHANLLPALVFFSEFHER
jgi:hypothetical protein